MLGCLDSNQEQRYQKPPCCQLHHTPLGDCVAIYYITPLRGVKRTTGYDNPNIVRLIIAAMRCPAPAAIMSCSGPGGVMSPTAHTP